MGAEIGVSPSQVRRAVIIAKGAPEIMSVTQEMLELIVADLTKKTLAKSGALHAHPNQGPGTLCLSLCLWEGGVK